MSPVGDALVVTADLDVHVVAPDGRTARIRLGDDGGTLVVDVQDVRVLLAALPRGSRAAVRPVVRTASDVLRRVREATGATWRQPVRLRLDGQVVAEHDGDRWRPGPGLRRPTVLVLALLASAVALAGLAALARRRRASG